MIPDIEEQWRIWQEENPVENVPDISDDELKESVLSDLSKVCKMTVGEYTLYQKWQEVQFKWPTQTINTIFGEEIQMVNPSEVSHIKSIYDDIWIPESIDDYMNLKPRLIHTDDTSFDTEIDLEGNDRIVKNKRSKDLPKKWNTFRTLTSVLRNNSLPGRNLRFIIEDEITGKLLGNICISSDFLDLTPRDKWIGWDRDIKTQGNMINHTAIGSSIVPVQPLGFNYVGGKLMALLCLSDTVQNTWKKQYGDTLVGVTTTSIYGKSKKGGLSTYDNLKHWKKMDYTSGSVAYETTKETQGKIRQWLHKNHTRKYFEWYGAKKPTGGVYKRDHRNRSYHFTYQKLGIPKEYIKSDHARGIYFSPLYNNTREFLCKQAQESDLQKSFDTSEEYLTTLWKEKYAKKRIENLVKNDRVSDETLFYDDLIVLSWEEAKDKYLSEIGR